jgi:1-acyl-sn-glycerol-3-phosphate acyltransferase
LPTLIGELKNVGNRAKKGERIMRMRERTIFDHFLLRPVLRLASRFILKITGWKVDGRVPDTPKYVMIAAPHTSNWDFVFTLLVCFSLKISPHILGKKELMEWPMGRFFPWLGIVPVDRSRSTNLVGQAVEAFESADRLVLLITPSGTRSKVKRWKTGFYHIACGANVPIALAYIDYARKLVGIGGSVTPTGSLEADMPKIKSFYADFLGKHSVPAVHYVSSEVRAPQS